jgi:hypothetical protein
MSTSTLFPEPASPSIGPLANLEPHHVSKRPSGSTTNADMRIQKIMMRPSTVRSRVKPAVAPYSIGWVPCQDPNR